MFSKVEVLTTTTVAVVAAATAFAAALLLPSSVRTSIANMFKFKSNHQYALDNDDCGYVTVLDTTTTKKTTDVNVDNPVTSSAVDNTDETNETSTIDNVHVQTYLAWKEPRQDESSLESQEELPELPKDTIAVKESASDDSDDSDNEYIHTY